MDIKKLNPWNWFKHEEGQDEKREIVPVKQGDYSQSQYPAANILQLHSEMGRLFEDAFRGFPSLGRSPFLEQMMGNSFMPIFRANVNVASDDKQYTITVEAPGMEQNDVSIEIKDRILYVRGDKQQEQEEKEKHYYRVERHYGAFERVLAIPDDGNTEEIKATMKNGVLTVNIPRMAVAAADVKKISIDS